MCLDNSYTQFTVSVCHTALDNSCIQFTVSVYHAALDNSCIQFSVHMLHCVSETNNEVSINAHFMKENLEKLLILLCVHGRFFMKG